MALMNSSVATGELEARLNGIIDKYMDQLSLKSFIIEMSYKADLENIDRWFLHINDNYPILIDDNMLKTIGYCDNDIVAAKRSFKAVLKKYDIVHYVYKYDEYVEYSNKSNKSELYPILDTQNAKQIHYVLMMPCDFKEVLMVIGTGKSREIRRYYVLLERIIKDYMLYQFMLEKADKKRIASMMQRMEVQNEEIKRQNEDIKRQNEDIKEKSKEIKRQNEEIKEKSKDIKRQNEIIEAQQVEITAEIKETNRLYKSMTKKLKTIISQCDILSDQQTTIFKSMNVIGKRMSKYD